MSTFPKHKAVVVGSGHNGLTAAIILAQNSWEVEVFEKSYTFWGLGSFCFRFWNGGNRRFWCRFPSFCLQKSNFQKMRLENRGLEWAQLVLQTALWPSLSDTNWKLLLFALEVPPGRIPLLLSVVSFFVSVVSLRKFKRSAF